jgi:hypothetical protein
MQSLAPYPKDVLNAGLCDWYAVEPKSVVRLAALWALPSFPTTTDSNKNADKEYAKFLALAVGDWDLLNKQAAQHPDHPYILEATPEAALTYKTEDQLLDAFAQANLSTKSSTAPSLWSQLPAYLESKDTWLVDTAADLVAESAPASEAAIFKKYMGSEFRLPIRMAALASTMRATTQPGDRQSQKAAWSALLNEALSQTCSPPYLLEVLSASPWSIGDDQWVNKDNRQLTIRRLLWLLPWADEQQTRHLLSLLKDCDPDIVTKEIVDWYGIEPDEMVRRKVQEYPPVEGIKYKPLLDLAKQDWDETNKSLAEEALNKLGP